MFLPVLAIASLLFFVGIVLLLWLADTLENRHQPAEEPVLITPFTFPSLPQAFEPMFAGLWEAPIQALELAHRTGRRGIPVSRLRPIFAVASKRFPEVYDGYGFEQWLQFMESAGLIQWSGKGLP